MAQLSPRYRNDNDKGVSEDIKVYLDRHFLYKLENFDIANPKLLVVFSAPNGVGKSSLSQRIKKDLQALVLENDAVKSQLLAYNPALTRDELSVITWKYTMDLYHRLSQVTTNGLIVRDGVIDWYYDRILPVFEKQGYALFIVGYDVSRDKRRELIAQRGDKQWASVERFELLMQDHDIHMARFRKAYKPDIILTDENLFDYDQVITKLQARLVELRRTA